MTREKLRAEEEAGYRAAQRLRDGARIEPGEELGSFSVSVSPTALEIRRLLIRLGIRPSWLVTLRPLFGGGDRARFDNFLRRYAYWFGVHRGLGASDLWHRLSRAPIILMYHAVGRSPEPASCYVIPIRRFRWQMRLLKWLGHRVIPFADLVECIKAGELPPARSVVITFDDGYADNLELAGPVLRRHGYPATIFLVSGLLGGSADWTSEAALRGRRLLTGAQVREMAGSTFDFGCHTRTHVSLTEADELEIDGEIAGARAELEAELGRPVTTFAYPYGDYDERVIERVARAGFEAACCSRSGPNDPAVPGLELRRLEIRGTDSLLTFVRMLWRGHRLPPRSDRGRKGTP